MTKSQAKKLFEKYNPVGDVVRCPAGRAKMRKPLDLYAKAAVSLYGIIRRDEFVEIFNSQNEEQTTADEVYIILLPNVLKSGDYGFYKEYIVHYVALTEFRWVDKLAQHQADKPRYIPPKEEFLKYEWEWYDDNKQWDKLMGFMQTAFGTTRGFEEIKLSVSQTRDIKQLGAIMEKYNLVFANQEQTQGFFNALTHAMNNSRIWENKGHTPDEMIKLAESKRPKEPVEFALNLPKKTEPNQPCPCGSGKKYKKCCSLIGKSGTAQLSFSERKLFYETWYKLLDFVNQKHKLFNMKIKPVYPAYRDEEVLHNIREKLWSNPKVISEFLNSTGSLSDEEIGLLKSWEKNYIKGEFLLVKYEPEHAVLMQISKGVTPRLYAIKGMTTSIAEAMQRRLPVMLETVLLPFGDKIIYDSYMASRDITFGDEIRNTLEKEYAVIMEEYGITTKLNAEEAGE